MYRMGMEEVEAVRRVIENGNLFRMNEGLREVENFEKELAAKFGSDYALCLSGGTAALTCALAGMGIGPGDEVIVPAYTFMATALAVVSAGAVPVIADIDDSMTLDMEDVRRKLTPEVRAVIPVHMVGFPCDMANLFSLQEEFGFRILEDACQAVGGAYKGRRLGTLGDAGCLSFNHYKIISAGEGGAVITDDRKIFERASIYHDGGSAFRKQVRSLQEPVFMGSQYRVSEITGAVMRVQLGRLDGIISDLRRVKNTILSALDDTPGIRPAPRHDPDGECATTMAFSFDSEEEARGFAAGADGWLPIDSGKHVYSNWEPLLEKRGAHHEALNPFKLEANSRLRTDYRRDMCPRTLEILSRTVFVNMNPEWSGNEAAEVAERCRKALPVS